MSNTEQVLTKQQLFSHLPPIMKTIQVRQTRHIEPIYNSSVPIQDITLNTHQGGWTIGKGGERESGRFMLAVWHGDDTYCTKFLLGSVILFKYIYVYIHILKSAYLGWKFLLRHVLFKMIEHCLLFLILIF